MSYVVRSGEGVYSLGHRVHYLSKLYEQSFRLSAVVEPILHDLAARRGQVRRTRWSSAANGSVCSGSIRPRVCASRAFPAMCGISIARPPATYCGTGDSTNPSSISCRLYQYSSPVHTMPIRLLPRCPFSARATNSWRSQRCRARHRVWKRHAPTVRRSQGMSVPRSTCRVGWAPAQHSASASIVTHD